VFLREELCVQRNLTVMFRTWDTSTQYLHANATFYQLVTDAVEPHPKLVFSIKHTMLDFWYGAGGAAAVLVLRLLSLVLLTHTPPLSLYLSFSRFLLLCSLPRALAPFQSLSARNAALVHMRLCACGAVVQAARALQSHPGRGQAPADCGG
jgi:hypothetical protein